jgi:hypothetical protein
MMPLFRKLKHPAEGPSAKRLRANGKRLGNMPALTGHPTNHILLARNLQYHKRNLHLIGR